MWAAQRCIASRGCRLSLTHAVGRNLFCFVNCYLVYTAARLVLQQRGGQRPFQFEAVVVCG